MNPDGIGNGESLTTPPNPTVNEWGRALPGQRVENMGSSGQVAEQQAKAAEASETAQELDGIEGNPPTEKGVREAMEKLASPDRAGFEGQGVPVSAKEIPPSLVPPTVGVAAESPDQLTMQTGEGSEPMIPPPAATSPEMATPTVPDDGMGHPSLGGNPPQEVNTEQLPPAPIADKGDTPRTESPVKTPHPAPAEATTPPPGEHIPAPTPDQSPLPTPAPHEDTLAEFSPAPTSEAQIEGPVPTTPPREVISVDNNEKQHEKTDEKPRPPEEVQEELIKKAQALPAKVYARLASESQDPETQTLQAEFRTRIAEIVPNLEGLQRERDKLQEAYDQASSTVKEDKKTGKEAKKDMQETKATILKRRIEMVDAILGNATSQAAIEIVSKHPEMQEYQELVAIKGATQEKIKGTLEHQQKESSAQISFGLAYRIAEQPRVSQLNKLAEDTDMALNENRVNTAGISKMEINLLQEVSKGEAVESLIQRWGEEQDPAKKQALADQIMILEKSSDLNVVIDNSAKNLALNREKLSLLTEKRRRRTMEKAAAEADLASKDKLDGEYQTIFNRRLAHLYKELDNRAKLNIELRKAPDKRDIAKIDNLTEELGKSEMEGKRAEPEMKDAQKELKKRVRIRAKQLRHAWQDYRAIIRDKGASGEAKKMAKEELWRSIRSFGWEASKAGTRMSFILNLILAGVTIFMMMKAAAFVFNQEK